MSTVERKQDRPDEAPGQNKQYTIIVNARQKTVTEHKLSFLDVIKLAFDDANQDDTTAYTVTYTKGKDKPEGSMVAGSVVTVKDGMIFNVTRTNKS